MEPEELETRNALLAYYSSRASDHATQLLTIALIGLTLIEVRLSSYVLVFGLPAVIVAALWVAGRMVYWSYLSDVILHVPDSLGKELARKALPPEERKYFEPALESWGLHIGTVEVVAHYHQRWSCFDSLAPSRLVTLCAVYVYVVLVALAIVLLVNHGF
jgi:hypothetical protein